MRTIENTLITGAHLAFEEGRGYTFRAFWVEPQQNFENLASKTLFHAISDGFEEHE